MYILISVASICAVVLIACLLALVCRHHKTLWIASDDAILCFVSPAVIMLATFGFISVGWRVTHGGFAAVPSGGWIGSAVIVAAAVATWFLLSARIREAGRDASCSGAAP
ncbi:MAG: hypothetical protein O2979_09130 [Proteobacteria bacterium]|nr:hypothetical protein [Pseudomonadota bacterium]